MTKRTAVVRIVIRVATWMVNPDSEPGFAIQVVEDVRRRTLSVHPSQVRR